jgi:uncharacterized protein (TIGR00730 family)
MQSICVYCGSSRGNRDAYADSARMLAHTLVERNIRLIYGGATVGTMGVLADTVLELGGKVVGVIPEALTRKEIAHPDLDALHVTRSMHERKMLMADLADGFIALPGGLGTLEELFEIWTWAQLGFHAKPCGLLNIEGYFDALIGFLDHSTAEGFIKPLHRSMLLVETYPQTLLDRFVGYHPPIVEKLVGRNET